MIIISDNDQEYLEEKIPLALESIKNRKTRELLLLIDDWLMDYGFAPPDYYDYNDEGRKMQRVRDRIYERNVLDKRQGWKLNSD